MNQWLVAWRNLMRRKVRTFLTMMAIVIGVASTFAVISAVDTAERTIPLYMKAAFGKADFTINGEESYLSEEVHKEVEKLDHTTSISVIKETTKLHLEDKEISSIQKRVDISGYSRFDTALTDFKLIEGDLNADGAVITDRTAKVWKANVGDTISFDTDKGIKRIKVTAIIKYTVELMGPNNWGMAKYHP